MSLPFSLDPSGRIDPRPGPHLDPQPIPPPDMMKITWPDTVLTPEAASAQIGSKIRVNFAPQSYEAEITALEPDGQGNTIVTLKRLP